MKQRVGLARTLVMEPQLFLMDEPFGALDAQTRIDLQELLLSVWDELRRTVVFFTHDVDEAILLADVVIVMLARPCRIRSRTPALRRPHLWTPPPHAPLLTPLLLSQHTITHTVF